MCGKDMCHPKIEFDFYKKSPEYCIREKGLEAFPISIKYIFPYYLVLLQWIGSLLSGAQLYWMDIA